MIKYQLSLLDCVVTVLTAIPLYQTGSVTVRNGLGRKWFVTVFGVTGFVTVYNSLHSNTPSQSDWIFLLKEDATLD